MDFSVPKEVRGVDGSGAHVFVVQPDADAALVGGQLGGSIAKSLGTLGGKLEGNVILGTAAVTHSAVLRRSAFDHGAVKDQLAVLAGSLAEGQVGGGADLLNGRLGVKIRLAGLPRELQNQAVGVVMLASAASIRVSIAALRLSAYFFAPLMVLLSFVSLSLPIKSPFAVVIALAI